jgi:uncharacterized paraquat-inducible protein A
MLTPESKDLFARFTPTVSKPVEVPQKPTAVTARLDATEEGTCPYCHTPMRRSRAADLPVWVCDGDRHVAPVKS